MGHTFKRRHDLRARINAHVKRLERQRNKEGTPVSYAANNRPERLADALQLARAEVMKQGGKITVALGQGVELPEHWLSEPRLHIMHTVGLTYDQLQTAMPSNTRIVILTDRIPGAIYNPIHKEIKRRHINYLIRRGLPEVEHELEQWLRPIHEELPPPPTTPTPPEPPPPPPPADTLVTEIERDEVIRHHETAVAVTSTPLTDKDDMALKNAARGSLMKFVQEHANITHTGPIGEESQRVFAIAEREHFKTTRGSVEQAIRTLKKKAGIALNRASYGRHAHRPAPTAPAAKTTKPAATKKRDSAAHNGHAIIDVFDRVIAALGTLRAEIKSLDKVYRDYAELVEERDALKQRLDTLASAFKTITR